MARYHEESGGGVLASFLLCALAGAAVALLYAPASGDETRRKVADRAREGRDQAQRAFERGREAFEKARRTAGEAEETL